ncbi:MAG: hypothetical protein V2A76_06040 [Planctomycetota bacterium]
MKDHARQPTGDAELDRLRAALRESPSVEVPAGWRGGVLAEIRSHAVEGAEVTTLILRRTILRGALAAAILALASAGLSFGTGTGTETSMLVALGPESLLQLVLFF